VQSFLRAPNGPAQRSTGTHLPVRAASKALCAIVHKKGLRQNKASGNHAASNHTAS
jgi:hypothetical protein